MARPLHTAVGMSRSLVCCILVILPAAARAGSFDDLPIGDLHLHLPVEGEGHLNAGYEVLSGDGATTRGLRGQLLAGVHLDHGSVRPALEVGGTFAFGWFITGPMTPGFRSVGPEVLGGVYFPAGVHAYASFAPVYTSIGNGASWGTRAAIGSNFGRATWHYAERHHWDQDPNLFGLLLVAPEQLEVVCERDESTTRVGFAMSWGL